MTYHGIRKTIGLIDRIFCYHEFCDGPIKVYVCEIPGLMPVHKLAQSAIDEIKRCGNANLAEQRMIAERLF